MYVAQKGGKAGRQVVGRIAWVVVGWLCTKISWAESRQYSQEKGCARPQEGYMSKLFNCAFASFTLRL